MRDAELRGGPCERLRKASSWGLAEPGGRRRKVPQGWQDDRDGEWSSGAGACQQGGGEAKDEN